MKFTKVLENKCQLWNLKYKKGKLVKILDDSKTLKVE